MAYVMTDTATRERSRLVPIRATLKNGLKVRIDYVAESQLEAVRTMLNREIEVGISYPYPKPLDPDTFRAYFCSAEAFTVVQEDTGDVVGAFYIKPNYPGVASHYCNGGFLTVPAIRRQGLGSIMGRAFLRLAKDLGYRASMFNLVFVVNAASLALWRRLGFKELAVLPGVGNLKGHGYTDAIQFFHSLHDWVPPHDDGLEVSLEAAADYGAGGDAVGAGGGGSSVAGVDGGGGGGEGAGAGDGGSRE